MWKTHFIVESKGIVFHSPCGKRCGKLTSSVDNFSFAKVFHSFHRLDVTEPVEMWKT